MHPLARLLASVKGGDGAEQRTALKDVRCKIAVGEGNVDMDTPHRRLPRVWAQIRAIQRPVRGTTIDDWLLAAGGGARLGGEVGASTVGEADKVGRELRHSCVA